MGPRQGAPAHRCCALRSLVQQSRCYARPVLKSPPGPVMCLLPPTIVKLVPSVPLQLFQLFSTYSLMCQLYKFHSTSAVYPDSQGALQQLLCTLVRSQLGYVCCVPANQLHSARIICLAFAPAAI